MQRAWRVLLTDKFRESKYERILQQKNVMSNLCVPVQMELMNDVLYYESFTHRAGRRSQETDEPDSLVSDCPNLCLQHNPLNAHHRKCRTVFSQDGLRITIVTNVTNGMDKKVV